MAIAGALVFSTAIAIYVSIPDFPYGEKAWQVQLWSDPSGWWSEITWIMGFGVFVSLTLLFRSWFYSLKPDNELASKARLVAYLTASSWAIFTVAFLLHFKPVWSDAYASVALDSTGALHGLFYISVAHLGVFATVSGLALASRIVAIAAKRV